MVGSEVILIMIWFIFVYIFYIEYMLPLDANTCSFKKFIYSTNFFWDLSGIEGLYHQKFSPGDGANKWYKYV